MNASLKPAPGGAWNFWNILLAAYMAELGYVFLMSGNVSDIFPLETQAGCKFFSLRLYLAQKLSGRDIVVFWDKSAGFQFADEILGIAHAGDDSVVPMRERFKVAVGLNQQPTGNAAANIFAGIAGLGGNGDLPTDPEAAFRLLEKLVSLGTPEEKKAAVVIEYAESVLGENDYSSVPAVTLQRWASLDSPLKGTGNPVILVEKNPERVSRALKHDESNVVRVDIPRPTRDELAGYISWALPAHGVMLSNSLQPEVAANLAAGLRCKDMDDIFMSAILVDEPIHDQFIWSKKIALIEQQSGGVLRVVRPKHGFEAIGGLDYVKSALQMQVNKLRSGDRSCDKGWILMGPPGTGKTILAEALAKESGVNFVMLGEVQSKYVGESERNMRLALEIAKAMAPTIVFIDEAAEAIGNSDGFQGDSGVSSRLRGMLQNVIGDDENRGQLFFMLATNYPDRLPPAMLREGRMDKRVPLLVPNSEGRLKILSALCLKYGIGADKIDFDFAVSSTQGWTGAELEALLLRAKQFAEEEGTEVTVQTCHLKEAVEDYIPSRDQAAFDRMANLAIRYTNSRRLLPPEYRELAQWQPAEKTPSAEPPKDTTSLRRGLGEI